MKTTVSDTSAAKSISAYIILNKKGAYVGKVTAAFTQSRCLVNVFSDVDGFQSANATGYGYDKFTSAISGMKIDGIELFDHCGKTEGTRKLEKRLASLTTEKARILATRTGASLSNYNSTKGHFESVYMDSGLDRLKAFGYSVIQAI